MTNNLFLSPVWRQTDSVEVQIPRHGWLNVLIDKLIKSIDYCLWGGSSSAEWSLAAELGGGRLLRWRRRLLLTSGSRGLEWRATKSITTSDWWRPVTYDDIWLASEWRVRGRHVLTASQKMRGQKGQDVCVENEFNRLRSENHHSPPQIFQQHERGHLRGNV